VEEPADRALDARVEAAADNIRVDAATAEVVDAFGARGVPSILLKGPSIARWLYAGDEPRSYRDCDLLVPPRHARGAESTLADLGFERRFDDTRMPDWWREHASEWFRGRDGVTVDLHRTLPGAGVDDETVWGAISEDVEAMTVAGRPAAVLSLPARALLVALHAMHHGREWGTPLSDLERALDVVGDDTWRAAAHLADRLDATDAFAIGLRLHLRGAELADRLHLAAAVSVQATLLARTPPPVALGIEQLARAQGIRRLAAILARKFFPPPDFIRHWHPMASTGRTGLLLAYLYRPLWILRRSPPAFRAWRAARREISRRA
jgi:Uncharacterised nucleotidyltransferase